MTSEVFGITKDELFALILSQLPADVTWTPAQLLAATALARQMVAGPALYDAGKAMVAMYRERYELTDETEWITVNLEDALARAEGKET